MAIRRVPSDQILGVIGSSIGGNLTRAPLSLDQILAQSLRRAVAIMAPCSRHELEAAVSHAFAPAVPSGLDGLREQVSDILEELIVYGDILEMQADSDDDWHSASVLLRPAPPSFVCRADGSFAILGVAGEEITPLPAELAQRLTYSGVVRLLPAGSGPDLKAALSDLGLVELSEKVWLRLPERQTPASFLAPLWRALGQSAPLGSIEGLRVLDSSRKTRRYRDRWTESLVQLDGDYVARRPQRYGAPVWCLVRIIGGTPERFLDLHSEGDWERPCDIAWRVQMALDAAAGAPQLYEIVEANGRTSFGFGSPLPSWADRALIIQGDRIRIAGKLIAFELPDAATASAVTMLGDLLWLQAKRQGEARGP